MVGKADEKQEMTVPMKWRNFLVLGLLLLLKACIIAISPAIIQAAPWQVDIKIVGLKPEYMRGERIAARIKIKNIGVQKDTYWFDIINGTYLINSVSDTFWVDACYSGWTDGHVMQGNGEGELWPNFEKGISRTCEDKGGFLPPDDYVSFVKLKYKDGLGNYQYVYSETLRFKVIEPQGVNKEAFEPYWYASSTGTRENLPRLKEFADKYPNSIYAPCALDWYIYMMEWKGWTKLKTAEECEKLITKYPDYPRNHSIIGKMVRGCTRAGKGAEMYKKVESLRMHTKNAKTNVLNEAIDEWLEKLKNKDAK